MSIEETTTISAPIRNLDDLLKIFSSPLTYRFQSSPLIQRHTSPKEKVLLCHDMKGGYLQDRHNQGCDTNETCYRFFRWHLIDIFVYFAHQLVTIPPLVWIDCAHQNGVQILGTFITEFDDGKKICRQLFASDEMVDQVVEALASLMVWYNFDGYLLNIENPIESEHVERLLSFVVKLKSACAKLNANSVVLWYDSVTIHGDLKWQNQLNDLNQSFFHACDGIFLNYTWKPEILFQSKINAGNRDRDVFVGIDVFGRGCFGGGGFNTCEAMAISHQLGLSTALFAPGWLFETLNTDEFLENDRKFWSLLEPYANQRVLCLNSISTYFSDGFGKQFFLHGLNIGSHRWYHLSLQSYLPNSLSDHRWIINHDDAYFGGSCLEIQRGSNGSFHFFKCLMPIESTMEVTVVFKADVNVIIELKCDDGSLIRLDKADEEVVIRHWQRKSYRLTVKERLSITDISLVYDGTANPTIKLGYLSIRPVGSRSISVECLPPLIQSIEKNSNASMILHLNNSLSMDPSNIVFVFVRDRFERYRFLGATRQSFFMVFQSDIVNDKENYSSLVIRHYSLNNLDLLNEQILHTPISFDCLQGFYSKQSE